MSYIAFDLDALNRAPAAARAAGVREEDIISGLVRMWAWCFREKIAEVDAAQVRGHFGGDVAAALVAFGFLEARGEVWRVKGAERYLRVAEARSRGGKAASGNLKRGTRKAGGQPGAVPGVSRESAGGVAGEQPGLTPGSVPALTPSTEHRILKASAPMAPRDSDRLCADFAESVGSKYAWQGAKDGTALAYLLTVASIDEVSRRWRLGLKAPADDWASCRTVAQLRSKWNDLATVKAAFVSIEYQPSRIY